MATGETNFSLEGRKTWKVDRTPPAEGEQVLILRSDGNKTAIQSGTDKDGNPYIPFVKTKAQVKGSGKDGNPDKWVNIALFLGASGSRPPIDGQDGILALVRAMGERCEGSAFALVKGTHPNPKLADKGPAEWLDAVKIADYIRNHDKREFKARLRHKRRFDADKSSTKLEDKEAIIDYYIVDSSVAPASPDDAPVEVPDEAVDEAPVEAASTETSEEPAAEEQETSEPEQEEEPVKEEKEEPAPAKKPAPKPAAKPAAKSNGKKK